jgi:hypothetical protein
MTTFTRNIFSFAILLGSVMPAAAGQSANKTSSGVSVPPQAATALAPETVTEGKCRAHCGALSASVPHQPHQSVAETQAKASACLRQMSK